MKRANSFSRMVQGRTYGIVAAMLFFIVATCSFTACSKDDGISSISSPYADSRTVMVYMVAENSLSANVWADVHEMLAGMNNDSLKAGDRLIIYLDDLKMPRIYAVDKSTKKTSLTDLMPVLTYENEMNSASAEQLAAFIDYATTHYPADSYGLVMWSHASGWIPSSFSGDARNEVVERRKSFGVDNGKNTASNNGHQMEIIDMGKAMKGGVMLDFLFFDACMMQNIEVAYELRHSTKWIIASPAEIPGSGANYLSMTRAMFWETGYVDRMLQAYYQEYYKTYGLVISAVNTSMLDDYAAYMKSIVAAHRSEMMALDTSSMLDYIKYGTWTTDVPDFLDLQSIMLKVLDEQEYARWKAETDKFMTCMQAGHWYSRYNKNNVIDAAQCCGTSMFIPFEKYTSGFWAFNEAYLKTSWAKDVWME